MSVKFREGSENEVETFQDAETDEAIFKNRAG